MSLIFEEIYNLGVEEGIKLSQKAWRKEGIKEGRQQEKIRNLKIIMEVFHIDLEKEMLILDVPSKERDYYRKQLNHQ